MVAERSRLQGLRGFAQLSVVVKSIDDTVRFYEDLLGFEVDGDWEGDTEGLKAMIGIDGITGRSVVGNIGHLRVEFMDYSIFGRQRSRRRAASASTTSRSRSTTSMRSTSSAWR